MIMAAAKALASLSPARADKNAPLLPPIADSRKVSWWWPRPLAGRRWPTELPTPCDEAAFADRIRAYVWEPVYQPYERVETPS